MGGDRGTRGANGGVGSSPASGPATTDANGGVATTSSESSSSGCGCKMPGDAPTWSQPAALIALVVELLRRRRVKNAKRS